MTSELDSFETQLLHELRATVTARREAHPSPVRRWRRWPQAAAATTAAAVAGAVAVVALTGTPAFAVDVGPDGMVEVQVNRLEDAAGLERALEDAGVRADILYLGHRKKCAPGRYVEAPVETYRSRSSYSVGGNGIRVSLDRRDVADGRTLVITTSSITHGSAGSIGIAEGPVGPCVLVDDRDGI